MDRRRIVVHTTGDSISQSGIFKQSLVLPSSDVELLRLRLHEEALTKVTESSTILDDMGEHAERATILQSLGEDGGWKGIQRAAV